MSDDDDLVGCDWDCDFRWRDNVLLWKCPMNWITVFVLTASFNTNVDSFCNRKTKSINWIWRGECNPRRHETWKFCAVKACVRLDLDVNLKNMPPQHHLGRRKKTGTGLGNTQPEVRSGWVSGSQLPYTRIGLKKWTFLLQWHSLTSWSTISTPVLLRVFSTLNPNRSAIVWYNKLSMTRNDNDWFDLHESPAIESNSSWNENSFLRSARTKHYLIKVPHPAPHQWKSWHSPRQWTIHISVAIHFSLKLHCYVVPSRRHRKHRLNGWMHRTNLHRICYNDAKYRYRRSYSSVRKYADRVRSMSWQCWRIWQTQWMIEHTVERYDPIWSNCDSVRAEFYVRVAIWCVAGSYILWTFRESILRSSSDSCSTVVPLGVAVKFWKEKRILSSAEVNAVCGLSPLYTRRSIQRNECVEWKVKRLVPA